MTDRNQRFIFRLILTLIALIFVILKWDEYQSQKEWEEENRIVERIDFTPISRKQQMEKIVEKTYLGDKYEPTNCQ